MRAVVTGGAGFLGSHLCDKLLERGWDVLCLDNLITGAEMNVAHLSGNKNFQYLRDVYKRQPENHPVCSPSPERTVWGLQRDLNCLYFFPWPKNPAEFQARKRPPFAHFEGMGSCWPESIPVSYTHLDVYKRQSER